MRPDGAALVDALASANVQFVVVGEMSGLDPLRVVVSRHPTNLDALGRALDRLGARLQLAGANDANDANEANDAEDGVGSSPLAKVPERVGDPLGTLSVDTTLGGLTLIFGGPSASLYAETVAASQPLQVGERSIAWAAAPAEVNPEPRTTGRALGRRLLSLVEGLTHLVDQRASADRGASTGQSDSAGADRGASTGQSDSAGQNADTPETDPGPDPGPGTTTL